ncbi:hypothetical protein Tco_1449650 [Tanacetum coccineum]
MTTLKFADTHNMVAFLSKPAESKGFEQIVDFLNEHPIKHTLTVNLTIYTLCIEQFWATVKAKTVNGEVQLQALVDGKKIIITESTVRRDLQLEDVEGVNCLPNATIFEQLALMGLVVLDEAFYKELDDSLVRAATTASSLKAEQDSGNIIKTRSKTRSVNVSKLSNDSLLARGNTLQSGEDRLKLEELMALCTTLQSRVLDLETTKTTQANKIASLKRRFKKLERRNKSKTHRLKRIYRVGSLRRVESSDEEGLGEENASKQGRIADIDTDTGITLVSTHFDTDTDMFGVNDLNGDEVVVESKDIVKTAEETVNAATITVSTASTIPVSATTTTTTVITDDEITLAKALAKLKSAKPTTTASTRPKAKGIVIHEYEQAPTPTISSQQPSQVKVQDKGKSKMVEPEPVKKMSKKDLLRLDEELSFKLQAKEEEEERLAREKAQQVEEVNIAWDDVHAKIEADYQLAQRLQAQEQEELTDEEKARLFVQFLEQRRKYFAAKRAGKKRNKPPTRAQQRSIMCTYLKNIEGWKPKSLKNESFANIQELFDKAMKRVNTFVDYRTELVEESSKKAKTELEESSSKKTKAEIA